MQYRKGFETMKNKRIISTLFITMILTTLFLPFGKTFAYTNSLYGTGLLNLQKTSSSSGWTPGTTDRLTDNDLTTNYVYFAGTNYFAEWTFASPKRINSIFVASNNRVLVEFYDSNNTLLGQELTGAFSTTGFIHNTSKTYENVSKVRLKQNGATNVQVYEFDVYPNPWKHYNSGLLDDPELSFTYGGGATSALHDDNLTSSNVYIPYDEKTINLNKDITANYLYIKRTNNSLWVDLKNNGVLVKKVVLNLLDGHVDLGGLYTFDSITFGGNSGNVTIYEVEFFGSNVVHADVSNITTTVNENDVSLNYVIPSNNPDFTGTKIYRNGELIATRDYLSTAYEDTAPWGSDSTYRITATYNDNFETAGITSTVTIGPDPKTLPLPEVTGIETEQTHNQVELTFTPPESENLDFIEIYRDGQKIGTTKETSFTDDLNLEPSKEYIYTIKTVTIYGVASPGVSKTIETDPEPKPIINGAEFKDTAGGYLVTWETPTIGTIKILVGGTEYKIVPAADQEITIPKTDLKYTSMGDPDVSLVPIGEYGTEGEKVDSKKVLESLKVPFSVTDLIKSGTGLVWLVSGFLLLALAFLLVPKLRNLIFIALGKKDKQQPGTRRTEEPGKENLIPGMRRTEEPGTSSSQEKEIYSKVTEKPIQREREVRELKPTRISKRARREPRARTRTETREPRQPRTGRGRN